MSPDPQFPWWILANAIGGVLAFAACAAFRPVSRLIARRRTSKLPKCPDADRAKEELEGWAIDLGAVGRVELAANLFLNLRRLRQELAQRAAETPLEGTAKEEREPLNLTATDVVRVIEMCMTLREQCRTFRIESLESLTRGAHSANSIEQAAGPEYDQLQRPDKDELARICSDQSTKVSTLTLILKGATRLDQFQGHPVRNSPAFRTMVEELYGLENVLKQEAELDRRLRHVLQRTEERGRGAPDKTPDERWSRRE